MRHCPPLVPQGRTTEFSPIASANALIRRGRTAGACNQQTQSPINRLSDWVCTLCTSTSCHCFIISLPVGCDVLRWACLYVCLVCLFVCVAVRSPYLENTCPNFVEFLAHVTCGCGTIFFWRQCNMLYILPFLSITSCFQIIERIGRNQRWRCFVYFARWQHQSDVRQRCLVEFARMEAPGGEVWRLRLHLVVTHFS